MTGDTPALGVREVGLNSSSKESVCGLLLTRLRIRMVRCCSCLQSTDHGWHFHLRSCCVCLTDADERRMNPVRREESTN